MNRNYHKSARMLPAILLVMLMILSCVTGQTPVTVDKLPPPPPVPKRKTKPSPPPPKDDDMDIVRVSSNLVMVPVSVTNGSGQPVTGLSAADFELQEKGRTHEIAQIGDPAQVPLDIAILLDVSGSVDARFDFEKESVSRFFTQVLNAVDRTALFAIGQAPRLEQGLDTVARTTRKLKSMKPTKSATAFYDTVIEGARYLASSARPERRRVILVISDGEDNFSDRVKTAIGITSNEPNAATIQTRRSVNDRVLLEVQRELQKADATFYSINPSGPTLRINLVSQRAQDGMEQLATSTGGASFVPNKLEDLDSVFRQIASELRSQYLLQYYSKSEAQPGTFLPIAVHIPNRGDLRIRARQGYYVKHK